MCLIVDAIGTSSKGPFWPAPTGSSAASPTRRPHGRIERTDGSVADLQLLPLATAAASPIFDAMHAVSGAARATPRADRRPAQIRVIANVSYELRTPSTPSSGFAEMLDQRYFGELNERQSVQPQRLGPRTAC
jgi:signal transduction histidine kinase